MKLADILAKTPRTIHHGSPELQLMEAACRGDGEAAAALFEENQQFHRISAVDTPQGRYEGRAAIRAYAESFLRDYQADSARLEVSTQVRAAGRSADEITIHFTREDGDLSIPMVLIGDLRPGGKLDEVRLYHFWDWVPGFSAYRRIIYPAEHMTPAPFSMMTGSLSEYFRILHTDAPIEDRIPGICGVATEDVLYGGYRPDWVEPLSFGRENYSKHYYFIFADAPKHYRVRAEAITDDGLIAFVEWTLVVPEEGYEYGRVSQSGVAVYERDPDSGLLCGVRICDNVGEEDHILPEDLPEEIRPLVLRYRSSSAGSSSLLT